MVIRAIVFDMDDTLYNEKDYVVSGLKAVDNWFVENHRQTGFYHTAIELFNQGERKFIFNKVLEELDVLYEECLISSMIEHYRSHEPNITLSEEAEWVLDNLFPSVKVGLISDGYLVTQEQKVKALKLPERLHSIILTDQLGKEYWKPSRVPYEEMSKSLQVSSYQCVYIGDNLTKDFVTAKKLGWTTVHINRKDGIYYGSIVEEDHKAHYEISNLKELCTIPVLRHMFLLEQKPI
ncbi:haloacid dehalogenase [Bacillus manliponensis]|uniref:Haloacid dehalogenase n=1 Tax=Bacillus manliponensis TaxID=574376 RepID=A0A073K1G9_9BACI|nr:HAD family hydrolase [Bacillus manliponensis]KEK20292.1 haloacid dehalogenase [Bacillus manliponensis]